MNKKLVTIFLCAMAITIGLTGCYWNAGNVATTSPTMTLPNTYKVTAPASLGPVGSIAPMESPLTVSPTIYTTPKATTVSSSKATNITLANAIVNMSKIKSAVVVRNEGNAIVGVMFDRDKYNGDLTETMRQEIVQAMVAKDSSLTNIAITDNSTYYYKIEDLAKKTTLSSSELQKQMDAIIK